MAIRLDSQTKILLSQFDEITHFLSFQGSFITFTKNENDKVIK